MLFTWLKTPTERRRCKATRFSSTIRVADFLKATSVRTEGPFSAFGWLSRLWDEGSFSPLKRCPVVVPARRRGSRSR